MHFIGRLCKRKSSNIHHKYSAKNSNVTLTPLKNFRSHKYMSRSKRRVILDLFPWNAASKQHGRGNIVVSNCELSGETDGPEAIVRASWYGCKARSGGSSLWCWCRAFDHCITTKRLWTTMRSATYRPKTNLPKKGRRRWTMSLLNVTSPFCQMVDTSVEYVKTVTANLVSHETIWKHFSKNNIDYLF